MRRRSVSVATPAAIAAISAVLLAGLTGCATTGDDGHAEGQLASTGCTNLLQPGALSNGVRVGTSGADVVGPTDIVNAQRTVIEHGAADGHVAEPGDIVTVDLTAYDAVTGDTLDQRTAAPHLALPESLLPDARKALRSADTSDSVTFDYLVATALICATPGDTIAVALTPAQSMASQLSMNATVAVIDVLDTFASTAQGSAQALPNGFPAVTTDETGRPGVVLPPQAAPSSQRVAPRILGDGEKVGADDALFGQVLTVSWSGNVVENTWENGIVGLGTEDQPNPAYAFRDALTGFPVGSQIVILDPNDGDPVVHVIDLLASS